MYGKLYQEMKERAENSGQVVSFAQHPQTMGEMRALTKTEDAGYLVNPAKWTPRDMLVHLLRRIDSGELNVETMVVVGARSHLDSEHTTWYSASPHGSIYRSGLLHSAAQEMVG